MGGVNINPDFEMIGNILKELNGVFDAYDLFHHSSSSEMFEFAYLKDNARREAWHITFMGNTVVSGGMYGLDYDGFYEENYLSLIKENAEKIYKQAYEGAIEYISNILRLVALSNISKDNKQNWINIINDGIIKVEEDKQN